MSPFVDAVETFDLDRFLAARSPVEVAHELLELMTADDARRVMRWMDSQNEEWWNNRQGELSFPGVVLVFAICTAANVHDVDDALYVPDGVSPAVAQVCENAAKAITRVSSTLRRRCVAA